MPTAPILILRSEQDVRDLLSDLREALRRSRRSGGAYPVIRCDDDGQEVLHIRIQVPAADLVPPARKEP
jgi:hypothetical protein